MVISANRRPCLGAYGRFDRTRKHWPARPNIAHRKWKTISTNGLFRCGWFRTHCWTRRVSSFHAPRGLQPRVEWEANGGRHPVTSICRHPGMSLAPSSPIRWRPPWRAMALGRLTETARPCRMVSSGCLVMAGSAPPPVNRVSQWGLFEYLYTPDSRRACTNFTGPGVPRAPGSETEGPKNLGGKNKPRVSLFCYRPPGRTPYCPPPTGLFSVPGRTAGPPLNCTAPTC